MSLSTSSFQFAEVFKSNLGYSSILVYLYLERHGAKYARCFHSTQTIANGLNISRRTVFRALKELEAEGFIIIINRYRRSGAKTSNVYEILK